MGNPGQVDGTLTTIAVSPLDGDVIWAGSDDGHVQSPTERRRHLERRLGRPARALDHLGATRSLRSRDGLRRRSPASAGPSPCRTSIGPTDLGASWEPIAGNLPEAPVNDLLADPDLPGRYFVATDVGVFETADGGITWSAFGTELPRVVTTSLAFDRTNQILVVGTYGRSLFSAVIDPTRVFSDGFESGSTNQWTSSVP